MTQLISFRYSTWHWKVYLASKRAIDEISDQTHPTLEWDQLLDFSDALHRNDLEGSLVVVSAVKVFYLTFLRVNSLAGLRWD